MRNACQNTGYMPERACRLLSAVVFSIVHLCRAQHMFAIKGSELESWSAAAHGSANGNAFAAALVNLIGVQECDGGCRVDLGSV